MDREKRVPVGLCRHDLTRADREVAADVLDGDWLRNDLPLVQYLLERARKDVGRTTWPERYDDS